MALDQILVRVELAGTNQEAALDWLQSRAEKRAFSEQSRNTGRRSCLYVSMQEQRRLLSSSVTGSVKK